MAAAALKPVLLLAAAALLAADPGAAQLAKRRMGDTIGRGRAVDCLVDAPPRQRCTFYPRNGDGSFALESRAGGGHLYYATRVGPDTMRFADWDGGRRTVDLGVFARSRDDRACWVRRPDRRICAW